MRVLTVLTVLIALTTLAACGADGEPIQPSVATNVSVGSNGTHVGTHVSGTKGNVTVGVGLGL